MIARVFPGLAALRHYDRSSLGGDAARYLSLTVALTIMTGLCCIAAGAAGLGFLTNFLSRPILSGYLNGIALSIIVRQLGPLFGFRMESAGFFRLLFRFVSALEETHFLTLIVGIGTLLLLRVLKRIAPAFPAPLVVVVLGIAVSTAAGLGRAGVSLVGEIPSGLPALVLPISGRPISAPWPSAQSAWLSSASTAAW